MTVPAAVPASPGVKRKRPVPLPPQLAFLVTETEGLTKVEEPHSTSGPDSCTAQTSDGRVPPLTDSTQDQKSGMLNHPELLDMVAELPSPNFFQLHPFFIWKPESHIMVRPVAGTGPDNPPWVEKLPVRFTNLLPAFLTYKKAACKSVMDELRRSGKSPTDMANQVNELMHLKYERAHLAYLHAVQNVREAEAGAYGQRTIGQYVRMEDRPRAFGSYEDQEGWGGVSVSGFYLTGCLLDEFKRQQPSLTKLLQGTLGQVFRWDHTRKMARKVTLASGAMSSFAVMNENWLIVSWVMVQAETERSLHPMYQGMAQRYSHAGEDLKRLRDAYEFCGIRPANPTKRHVREHCRTKIPQPSELLERVERVVQHFHLATDPNHVPLFKPSILKTWRVQRVHILRGCLSDPELSEGIMYRDGGTLQLNHVAGEGAKVPVWIPVRGTSQQEGYHFQQAQWVTGPQVSPELFRAQAMTGVVRWNFQRPVDMKKPGAVLPAVFDPASMWELNSASMAVTGQDKCPAFTSLTETLEKGLGWSPENRAAVRSLWTGTNTKCSRGIGLRLLCPLPLQTMLLAQHLPPAGQQRLLCRRFPLRHLSASISLLLDVRLWSFAPAAEVLAEERPHWTHEDWWWSVCLGPHRWTLPMKDAIDSLLQYHHGDKDILRLVDPDYADMVHRSAADPNSLLRPTTRFHISRYVKHLAKLLNTSSSLNTSPEKLLETQQLWYSLTEGSKTTSVPVVTMETAVVTPPTAALPTPLTQDSIEKIVQGILEMEQQQRPEQKMRQTKPCLACGQPKSPYGTGGSSIHFFYQQGPVRYFYCSRKVHQTYAAEGLSDPRMPFEQLPRQSFSRGSWRPPKSVWRTKLRDRSAVFSFMMASQMIFFHYRHPFSTQKTPRFPSCLREHVLPLPPCLNPRFSVSTFPFAILWVSER
ncbi:hypothetical protein D4764_0101090 [Takifugu flavidus]|uniref:Uncharacterized protein n=1 Tax=Takifugu flavidus TaxID=433684 RepID=A0A5C6MHX7_9TELE|nr:hypothetical protein D4764_0101090 [Takifugu flavidus]